MTKAIIGTLEARILWHKNRWAYPSLANFQGMFTKFTMLSSLLRLNLNIIGKWCVIIQTIMGKISDSGGFLLPSNQYTMSTSIATVDLTCDNSSFT